VNERPANKEDRLIYKYLCPICFRYYNEILECLSCENYLCIFCVRDLIKTELKRTRQLSPMPPESDIQIFCPQCMNKDEPIFQDVDKTRPVK